MVNVSVTFRFRKAESMMENILAKALGQDAGQLAAEKRDLLARLLGRLAHEIRNPLSSLDVHVQLLEEDLGDLAPDVRNKLTSRLEIIHGELRRLDTIVKQFLRLADPSSLDLERVDPLKIVRHLVDLLRPEAAARGIEIVLVPEAVPPTFLADPSQLTQALLNLVVNAIQAVGRNGRVELRIVHQPAADELLIIVRDTGPGVSVEMQRKIFEPYFTTKNDGTGIGLWITQQIATAHGGSILVSNATEGGAIFTLHLSLKGKEPQLG